MVNFNEGWLLSHGCDFSEAESRIDGVDKFRVVKDGEDGGRS